MKLMSKEEAEAILHTNKRLLEKRIQTGALKAYDVGDCKMLDPNEVYDLAELESKTPSPKKLLTLYRKLEMRARRSEKMIEQLMVLMGVDYKYIPLDEDGVISLHLKVIEAIEHPGGFRLDEVYDWSRTFAAISEEYFSVLAKSLEVNEPWVMYLQLAIKISEKTPHDEILRNKEAQFVYGALQKARVILRQTAFFYVRNIYGLGDAIKLFPDVKGDQQEDVLSIALCIMDVRRSEYLTREKKKNSDKNNRKKDETKK